MFSLYYFFFLKTLKSGLHKIRSKKWNRHCHCHCNWNCLIIFFLFQHDKMSESLWRLESQRISPSWAVHVRPIQVEGFQTENSITTQSWLTGLNQEMVQKKISALYFWSNVKWTVGYVSKSQIKRPIADNRQWPCPRTFHISDNNFCLTHN
jgi:hypothetical protein